MKKLRRFDNTMVNAPTLSLMKIYRMSLISARSIPLDSTFKETSHNDFGQFFTEPPLKPHRIGYKRLSPKISG
jgi:hypothetical protein